MPTCTQTGSTCRAAPSSAGCLAGFQPSNVLQSEVLASRRILPWQPPATGLPASHHQVLVAAGTATGSVLVWQAAGQGEQTWQLCCQGHQVSTLMSSGAISVQEHGLRKPDAVSYTSSDLDHPSAPVCQYCY